MADLVLTDDADRVRLITLNRPDKLNAFSDALYFATADALQAAADDSEVSVVVITGNGRAFSAGADVKEMADRGSGRGEGESGFPVFIDSLVAYPKPIIAAVNGLAVGVGATMLALVDLVLMSTEARVRTPFTELGVAPEAGSSFTFPHLLGRHTGAWVLLSSEWFSAVDCQRIGLAWKVCEPEQLLDEAMDHARILAAKPLESLMESKRTIVAPYQDAIAAARERENAAFARLLGGPANAAALKKLT